MTEPQTATALYEHAAANPLGPIPIQSWQYPEGSSTTSERSQMAVELAMCGTCPWCMDEDCFVQIESDDRSGPIAICLNDDCNGSFQSRGIAECVPTIEELRRMMTRDDEYADFDDPNMMAYLEYLDSAYF